jgi:hypothetical protein
MKVILECDDTSEARVVFHSRDFQCALYDIYEMVHKDQSEKYAELLDIFSGILNDNGLIIDDLYI